MGRKPTPQPLTLPDSHSHSHSASNANVHANGNGNSNSNVHANANGHTLNNLHSLSSLHRDNASFVSGDSLPHALSSTDSKSASSQLSFNFTNGFSSAATPTVPSARSPLPPTADSAADWQRFQHPDPARDSAPPPSHRPATSALEAASSAAAANRPQPVARQQTEGRKSSKSGFFNFSKNSRVGSQPLPLVQSAPDTRQQTAPRGVGHLAADNYRESPYSEAFPQPNYPLPSRSELSLSSAGDPEGASAQLQARKAKAKTFGLLGRTKSQRDKERGSPKVAPVTLPNTPSIPALYDTSAPLRTAPVAQDRSFREMMNSSIRNRSEDRALGRDGTASRENLRDRDPKPLPSSYKDSGGSTFLSGLRNSSTRAADMISKGLFGKSSRSGSTTEKEAVIDDEHYVIKVLNLPLVEQARLTRISKRLEHSRDKTEFWMPAFPWRAIDYLNYKGCDVEGLYRVPGSGPQIKKWQRRFDEQHDVNLFEVGDLYDINIVGSMLKAWLRELPDELFPKASQDRIARECAGAEEVPPLLIEELSNLSPFNYYLLFAITCHLSLLLAHSDKNKMDFRNLCICFQPCMKIDAFCFRFLVCDWRNCWKGCKNEAKFIEEEYKLFDQPPPRGISESRQPTEPEMHQPGPSEGNAVANQGNINTRDATGYKPLQSSRSNASIGSNISSELARESKDDGENGRTGTTDMRPLSPIKPLSPLGF